MNQRNTRQAVGKFLFAPLLVLGLSASSQKTVIVDSSGPGFHTVIAGKEYGSSPRHEWLWGEDYRREWTTPVRIPVLNLDSAFGGLTPVEQGGGRQTKSLRLKDAAGRQYVLRSVNKTYSGALPAIARGTFIERLANDQIATNHPYAALAVAPLAEAARVYHTHPAYYVVPYSPRLGAFNETFANTLCLLEERPDDTQLGQESFGHPEDIVSTENMLEKITGQNDHVMDQGDYLKTRLFDMVIGDWGRHPDNWRWAKWDSGSFKLYRPVPKDRDQAFAKFEGLMLSLIVRGAGLKQLQTFDDRIKNVEWFNYAANELDKRFTNGLSKQAWIDSSRAIQRYLTDSVIENAIRQMPPAIFAESGNEIILKIESRRDHLVDYAMDYYGFLAKRVDIGGSRQKELFTIRRLNGEATSVQVYPVNKHGEINAVPTLSRTFLASETREIRLYGIDGNDLFTIIGDTNNRIRIRIIGGPGTDTVNNRSATVKYYDNPGNIVSGKLKKHLSADSSINHFDSERFSFDKKGVFVMPNYTNTRGVFVELGYKKTKQQWRKQPFGWRQSAKLNYSFFNHSFGGDYAGVFNEVLGKWNLLLDASFDQKLKNYFFGLGNESVYDRKIGYYKLHTMEGKASVGLSRTFARHHSVMIAGFVQTVKVKNELAHLTSETLPSSSFRTNNFAGALASYTYYEVNDEKVPTRGFGFSINGSHEKNLGPSRSFSRYWSTLGFYLPVSKAISLASRNGCYTLTGEPEFYQFNWIGGGQNLRGFHRERFYGKTTFYNNNELRWIPEVHSYWYSGKIGLIGFVDEGRVWMPGQSSTQWHVGYGGGLLLSPFNKVTATAYYGFSQDDRVIHIRLGRFF